MINSTLCYLERGGEYLMLHRTKKRQDGKRGQVDRRGRQF